MRRKPMPDSVFVVAAALTPRVHASSPAAGCVTTRSSYQAIRGSRCRPPTLSAALRRLPAVLTGCFWASHIQRFAISGVSDQLRHQSCGDLVPPAAAVVHWYDKAPASPQTMAPAAAESGQQILGPPLGDTDAMPAEYLKLGRHIANRRYRRPKRSCGAIIGVDESRPASGRLHPSQWCVMTRDSCERL